MRNEKSADRIYLVTRRENQVMSFLMHGSRAIEIHSDSYEKKSSDTVALGDIYIGRIQNIVKNINAAFVELTPGNVCYLPWRISMQPIYTKKGAILQSHRPGDEAARAGPAGRDQDKSTCRHDKSDTAWEVYAADNREPTAVRIR